MGKQEYKIKGDYRPSEVQLSEDPTPPELQLTPEINGDYRPSEEEEEQKPEFSSQFMAALSAPGQQVNRGVNQMLSGENITAGALNVVGGAANAIPAALFGAPMGLMRDLGLSEQADIIDWPFMLMHDARQTGERYLDEALGGLGISEELRNFYIDEKTAREIQEPIRGMSDLVLAGAVLGGVGRVKTAVTAPKKPVARPKIYKDTPIRFPVSESHRLTKGARKELQNALRHSKWGKKGKTPHGKLQQLSNKRLVELALEADIHFDWHAMGIPTTMVGRVNNPVVKHAREVLGELAGQRRSKKYKEAIKAGRTRQAGAIRGVSAQAAKREMGARETVGRKMAAARGPFAPTAIVRRFGENSLDFLNKIIEKSGYSDFDVMNMQRGLIDLFGEGEFGRFKDKLGRADKSKPMVEGKIPDKTVIRNLRDVFGENWIDINKATSLSMRAGRTGQEVINVPRSVMASTDMSMPLRQAAVYAWRHPIITAKNGWIMNKAFFSEKSYAATMKRIAEHERAEFYKEMTLELTDARALDIMKREEEFYGARLAEKIPVLGWGVKAANRAAHAFLNAERLDMMDLFYNDVLKKQGLSGKENYTALQMAAQIVNNNTGRGRLPGGLERAGPLLSALFFSPRLLAARVYSLFDINSHVAGYMSKDPGVRAVARRNTRDMVTYFGAYSTFLVGLSNLPGVSVEWNPLSADFYKAKIGNTRFDFGGGYAQLFRFLGQAGAGMTKGADGKIQDTDRWGSRLGTTLRFARSKLSPIGGVAVDALSKKNYYGEPIEWDKAAYERMYPLVIGDIYDAYEHGGYLMAGAAAFPAFFGATVSSYIPKKKKQAKVKIKLK